MHAITRVRPSSPQHESRLRNPRTMALWKSSQVPLAEFLPQPVSLWPQGSEFCKSCFAALANLQSRRFIVAVLVLTGPTLVNALVNANCLLDRCMTATMKHRHTPKCHQKPRKSVNVPTSGQQAAINMKLQHCIRDMPPCCPCVPHGPYEATYHIHEERRQSRLCPRVIHRITANAVNLKGAKPAEHNKCNLTVQWPCDGKLPCPQQ
jgi:hypothetical protein